MRHALTLIFLFWSLLLPFSVFGQEPTSEPPPITVAYEAVNPADGFSYTFKRLGEKITLLVLSFLPEKKADFYQRLLNARLAELKYIVDKRDMANFQLATQRYSATAGQYTELLIRKKLNARKEEAVHLFGDHLKVVADLKSAFNDTTAEWRFVKQDEDYLRIYIAQLKE